MLTNTLKHTVRDIRYLIGIGIPAAETPALHVVLADSRSGSTWLQEHLGCHPSNTELGEIYNQRNLIVRTGSAARQLGYFDYLARGAETDHVGCKITFTQAVRHLEPHLFLLRYKAARFLVLERENVVQSAVSLLIAQQTGQYHVRSSGPGGRYYIDPRELKVLIEARKAYRDAVLRLLNAAGIDFLQLTYEQLVVQTEDVVGQCFDYIGLDRVRTSSALRKGNPKQLSDIIANYEEVQGFFRTYPEAMFFDS